MLHSKLITLLLALILCGSSIAEEPRQADVVVYGSTPGGFCAAIAAAREGASVILLEPTIHIGGLSTGGLSHCDSNQMVRSTVMGLFDEWHKRIVKDYTDRGLKAPYDPTNKDTARWTFEPHVAMRVTQQMLTEAGVTVLTEQQLTSVDKQGSHISQLATNTGTFKAKVFIDGTYEGDLMAAAGVDWTIGREGRDEFGESLAGRQYPKKKMEINGLDENGKSLPLVTANRKGQDSAGDDRIMTYSFRLCLTKDSNNRVRIPQPDNYEPARFEVIRRFLNSGGNVNQIGFDSYPLPGDKFDGNNSIGRQFSIGLIGGGNDWHASDASSRREIWEAHKQYTLEFYKFLTTDPAVPQPIRSKYAEFGLCKDEFAKHDHWPPALYVRESRRMKGMYVISQKDILEEPVKSDPIAVSSFPIDSHDVQRIALTDGGVINEGTIFPVRRRGKRTGYAYHVPYRAVLPKRDQCDNLLVPVALSCTHVGISSLRIEGAWMVIGQGAGVAAALAAEDNTPVHDVPYHLLRKRLHAQNQVLELPGSNPGARFDPIIQNIEGWTVYVEPALLEGEHTAVGKRSIGMLRNHLERIAVLVPEPALSKLRKVGIWIEVDNPLTNVEPGPYHGGGEWLKQNGYDIRMVDCVHITRAASLLDRNQMLKHPMVILHELAHAYHDQFLEDAYQNRQVLDAYNSAMKAGLYDSVEDHRGRAVRAYAATNQMEYFAEATEAYFYRNDFYPFLNTELKRHDPSGHALMEKIWGKLE